MLSRLVILILMVSSSVCAQVVPGDSTRLLTKKINSFEIINAGLSIPVGDFGNMEKTGKSGFAKPGVRLDMAYNTQLYKHLGIKAMLIYQNNLLDKEKFKNGLEKENAANSYTISSGGWNNISAMLGAFINFNISKGLCIQPRFNFGLNYGISPNINITVSDSAKNVYTITQKKGQAIAFCFLLGTDIKANVGHDLQLVLGFDAFASDVRFTKIRVENSFKNSVYNFTTDQHIGNVGLKIGIAKTLK